MKKVLVGVCLSLVASLAIAQELPPITLTPSISAGTETLTTTVTWDAPGYLGCVGSGHEPWNGDKPASGTQELPTIAKSGTYTLILTCTYPGDRVARLSWTPPTTNTDGTPLTNLDGFHVHWGRSADVLSESLYINNPEATGHVFENMALGTWFFAVTAANEQGTLSARSNVVSKVITAGGEQTNSASLTVNPKPNGVSGFGVE